MVPVAASWFAAPACSLLFAMPSQTEFFLLGLSIVFIRMPRISSDIFPLNAWPALRHHPGSPRPQLCFPASLFHWSPSSVLATPFSLWAALGGSRADRNIIIDVCAPGLDRGYTKAGRSSTYSAWAGGSNYRYMSLYEPSHYLYP